MQRDGHASSRDGVRANRASHDTYDRGAGFLLSPVRRTKSLPNEAQIAPEGVGRFAVVPAALGSLHCRPMPPPPPMAPVLRVALAVLGVAIAASAWDLFAHQVPSSPWHVTGYPSAIDRLEMRAWIEAALLFALAPRALDRGFHRAGLVTGLAAVGSLLSLGSLAVSARSGVLALQLRDTTAFASGLLVARIVGDAMLLVALAITLRAAIGPERTS